MSESEKNPGTEGKRSTEEADAGPDMVRRDLFKRFGGYAAGTCAGLFILMSPRTSSAKTLGSDGAH